jgi:hypothetical protein
LLKTYTLYLRDGASDGRFEPVLCTSDWEARTRAAALLVQHPDSELIDVFFGDDLLFRVRLPTAS